MKVSLHRPRDAAQTALALLTASAYGDERTRNELLEELDADGMDAVVVSLLAMVVGGWPKDAEMPLNYWLEEVGKRMAGIAETLEP